MLVSVFIAGPPLASSEAIPPTSETHTPPDLPEGHGERQGHRDRTPSCLISENRRGRNRTKAAVAFVTAAIIAPSPRGSA
jgi:hypothetical protein